MLPTPVEFSPVKILIALGENKIKPSSSFRSLPESEGAYVSHRSSIGFPLLHTEGAQGFSRLSPRSVVSREAGPLSPAVVKSSALSLRGTLPSYQLHCLSGLGFPKHRCPASPGRPPLGVDPDPLQCAPSRETGWSRAPAEVPAGSLLESSRPAQPARCGPCRPPTHPTSSPIPWEQVGLKRSARGGRVALTHPEDEVESEEQILDALGASFDRHGGELG